MSLEKVLIITPDEERRINATIERSENEISEDVEKIKVWLKKQPHLPQDEDDIRIKNMLLLNKLSLEKTKKKLDMYYSIKHIVPEIFENRGPTNPRIISLMEHLIIFPLPHLTPECHRVYLFRLRDTDPGQFSMISYLKLIFSIFDLRIVSDFALGDQFIVDFEHFKLAHLIQFTPIMIMKAYTLLEKAYSDRIKQLHFLHVPAAAHAIVAFMTSILSEKIADRVSMHKDYKSICQKLPIEMLPNEYNGTAGAMDDLYDDWKKILASKNDWIVEIGNKRSDESRRIGEPLDSDMFGMCGSFRQLSVD